MPKLYVVGGRAKSNAHELQEYHRFERAVILSVDTATSRISEVAGWSSKADACPPEAPSFVFKAGTLTKDRLWVCTQTEILGYSVPDFRLCEYISLPFFNDLHHVVPTARNTLITAVTGLDMVAEVGMDGELLHGWDVLGQPLWSRFSRATDYRKVATTKPHSSHPNYVFGAGGEIWVTRLEQKDAVSLTGEMRRLPIEVGYPHDGHVAGDKVYFTTVNGFLVIADWREGRQDEVIDLTPIFNPSHGRPLGWCRGIKLLSGDRIVIGFSRLRQTALRDKVQWVKERAKALAGDRVKSWRAMPTRIACIDVKRKQVEWEIDLEDHGLNAVFSIHDSDAPDRIID